MAAGRSLRKELRTPQKWAGGCLCLKHLAKLGEDPHGAGRCPHSVVPVNKGIAFLTFSTILSKPREENKQDGKGDLGDRRANVQQE